MTYTSPESSIRKIMAESHAPALKIPEPDRVKEALEVLKNSGITSAAKKDDNTITVSAGEVEKAYNIMDRAIQYGYIQAKPQVVSPEAIDVPDMGVDQHEPKSEPHPPAGGQAFGEALDSQKELNDYADEVKSKTDDEDNTETNKGEVKDDKTNVELQQRSLVNRMENKLKKIDEDATSRDEELEAMINEAEQEDLDQLDEVSKGLLRNYLAKNWTNQDHLDAKHKETGMMTRKDLKKGANRQKGEDLAVKKMHGKAKVNTREEVEQIDELSYSKIHSYSKASFKEIKGGDAMDKRIARRKKGIEMAKKVKADKVSKAAFGEEFRAKSPAETVLNIYSRLQLDEARGQRLIATHHSECGKHLAKVYKDTEWNEHTVKYHINGKHHEPADSHHGDVDDAHDTARAELKRMTKLNGALKESTEEEIDELMEEFEQLDELSKNLLGRYIKKASQ